MTWDGYSSPGSDEMSVFSSPDTQRPNIIEAIPELPASDPASYDVYIVGKLEAARTALTKSATSTTQKEADAKAAAAKTATTKSLARKAAMKAAHRKEAEQAAAQYRSPGYDALSVLLGLNNPDEKELLQGAISCIKKLRGQRDYELERQEHAKLLTRRIIDDSELQANNYRLRCLELRNANNIMRAARGLPLHGDKFDNDHGDDDDDSDDDQQSHDTLQDPMEL